MGKTPGHSDMARPPAVDVATERTRRLADRMAADYDRAMDFNEKLLFTGGREWVCSQARGEVLEIGVGSGRNLPFYAGNVRLTGIELSPAMLALARERASTLGIQVDLRLGDAQMLPFAEDSFDTVVCTLSLCTIPDERAAVREAKRVLRPGGLFLLLEHVRSPWRVVRLGQRVLNLFSVRREGCHQLRQPLRHLSDEGFEIVALERRKLGIVERIAARKPMDAGTAAE